MSALPSGDRWIVALNIDFLQRYNDDHGHDSGDALRASLALAARSGAPDGTHAISVTGADCALASPIDDRAQIEAWAMNVVTGFRARSDADGRSATVSALVIPVACAAQRESSLDLYDAIRRAKQHGRNGVAGVAEPADPDALAMTWCPARE